MGVIYRVADGYTFDIDGYTVSNYIFFDSAEEAIEYCNNVAMEAGRILAITKTDEAFKKFYNKQIGR